ncbi:MAG: HD domain-containing phosphohydrolase [Clostridium sp.]
MPMRKHILIVDDDIINLKEAEKILKEKYKVTLLISGEEALKFLKKNKVDIIILDVEMPGLSGIDVMKKIKRSSVMKNMPIIFTGENLELERKAMRIENGGIDFFRKPFIEETLLKKLKNYIQFLNYKEEFKEILEEKVEIIEKLQTVMLFSLAELVECRDINTGGHVRRTAKYVEILIDEMKRKGIYKEILTEEYIKDTIRSAPLHDVGKIGIDDKTLLKNGSLSNEEFEFMKQHTTLGAKALQSMIEKTRGESFLYIAKDMAKYHHEKWNGKGYPEGLRGEEIPLCARIMAIADVYDALTTKRPYKEGFSHEMAYKLITENSDIMFDPKIVEIFKEIHEKFKKVK